MKKRYAFYRYRFSWWHDGEACHFVEILEDKKPNPRYLRIKYLKQDDVFTPKNSVDLVNKSRIQELTEIDLILHNIDLNEIGK